MLRDYFSHHFSTINLPSFGLNFTLTGIDPSHFNGNILSSTRRTGKYSRYLSSFLRKIVPLPSFPMISQRVNVTSVCAFKSCEQRVRGYMWVLVVCLDFGFAYEFFCIDNVDAVKDCCKHRCNDAAYHYGNCKFDWSNGPWNRDEG